MPRTNPALEHRLRLLLSNTDTEGLRQFFGSASNQEARTAGFLLGERLLPDARLVSAEAFWAFFGGLVPTFPKAYLGTFLKAAVKRYRDHTLSFDSPEWAAFAATATPIDRRKVLQSLLPALTQAEEVRQTLHLFGPDEPQAASAYLLPVGTPAAFFVFFKLCRQLEHEPQLLRHYCILLMQRGETLSFNMASILQAYFDLGPLPGTFSLSLKTYELSRLDENFETFRKTLLTR